MITMENDLIFFFDARFLSSVNDVFFPLPLPHLFSFFGPPSCLSMYMVLLSGVRILPQK